MPTKRKPPKRKPKPPQKGKGTKLKVAGAVALGAWLLLGATPHIIHAIK